MGPSISAHAVWIWTLQDSSSLTNARLNAIYAVPFRLFLRYTYLMLGLRIYHAPLIILYLVILALVLRFLWPLILILLGLWLVVHLLRVVLEAVLD